MEKIFNHKSFNYFVSTPLGSRVTSYIHVCLQVHLPPVSTTLAKLVAKCAAGVIDTSGAP
jgi:hypothetical protein